MAEPWEMDWSTGEPKPWEQNWQAPAVQPANGVGQAGNNMALREALERIPEEERTPGEVEALAALRLSATDDQAEYDKWTAAGRGFQQGVTFNLSDEAGAALRSATGMQDYDAALDMLRERDREAREKQPEMFFNGEFIGAGASGMVPVGAGLNYARGGTLAARSLWSGAGGAAAGFAQGYGRGEGETVAEGVKDRAVGAVVPMTVGGVAGAAAPVVGAAVGSGVRAATTRAPRIEGMDPAVSRKLAKDYERSRAVGIDPRAELERLGPDATLADVRGPFRQTALGLAATPGEGGARLARFANERKDASPQRIQTYIDDVLGGEGAAATTRDAQRAIRKSTYGPRYDEALDSVPDIDTSTLAKEMGNRLRITGPDDRDALMRFHRELGGGMSARQLHNIRSNLSDRAEMARRSGAEKQAGVFNREVRKLDEVLDANVPGYPEVRAAYAKSKAIDDAIKEGRQALVTGGKSPLRPDDLREMLGEMSPDEREAYRQGVREYIADRFGVVRTEQTAVSDLLKGMNRDRLAVILGPGEADKLVRQLQAERVFAQTNTELTGGSMTDLRKASREELGDFREPMTERRPGPIQQARRATGDVINSAIDAAVRPGIARRNRSLGDVLSEKQARGEEIIRQLEDVVAQQGEINRLSRAAEDFSQSAAGFGGMGLTTQLPR